MTELLAFEWRRMRSLRATWVLLALPVGVALLADLAVGIGNFKESVDAEALAFHVVQRDLLIRWLVAAAIGAQAFGHDFRYGTIRPTLLAFPRRGQLLAGKVMAASLLSAAAALAASAASIALLLALTSWDESVFADPRLWRSVALGIVTTGLVAALAVGLAVPTRAGWQQAVVVPGEGQRSSNRGRWCLASWRLDRWCLASWRLGRWRFGRWRLGRRRSSEHWFAVVRGRVALAGDAIAPRLVVAVCRTWTGVQPIRVRWVATKVRLGSGLGLEVIAVLVVLGEGRDGPQGQDHGSGEQDDAVTPQPPPDLPRRPGQAGRPGRPAATDGPAPPADPPRRRAAARRPVRRPTHRRWPPPDPPGHRRGRPGRAARCRSGRGRRPRSGRADRPVGGDTGRR